MTAITCSIRSNSSDEMGRWTPFGEGLELATDVFPLYSKNCSQHCRSSRAVVIVVIVFSTPSSSSFLES